MQCIDENWLVVAASKCCRRWAARSDWPHFIDQTLLMVAAETRDLAAQVEVQASSLSSSGCYLLLTATSSVFQWQSRPSSKDDQKAATGFANRCRASHNSLCPRSPSTYLDLYTETGQGVEAWSNNWCESWLFIRVFQVCRPLAALTVAVSVVSSSACSMVRLKHIASTSHLT